jgi:hypothetical protein
MKEYKCKHCEKEFESPHVKKYCSDYCFAHGLRKRAKMRFGRPSCTARSTFEMKRKYYEETKAEFDHIRHGRTDRRKEE